MPVAEVSLIISNKVGLHARPASLLVQTAVRFQSRIQVHCKQKVANAKSFVSILKLEAEQGDTIFVQAEGDDAAQAIETLTGLVQRKFDEEE